MSASTIIPSSGLGGATSASPTFLTDNHLLPPDSLTPSLFLLAEISPDTAKVLSVILGPIFAALNLLFIFRIVMSWYPQLPVKEFPFNIAYTPTEPILSMTRRLVPPVGGVDIAPVIWLAIFSFINEILLGQQGLLILISQQQI